MKKAYYSFAGIVVVLALILIFENVMSGGIVLIFFDMVKAFWGLAFLFLLGLIAGFFLGLAINADKPNNIINDLDL